MNKRDVHGDNLRIPGGSLSVQKGVSEYPPGLYIVPFGRFEVSLYTFTQANFFLRTPDMLIITRAHTTYGGV